MKYSLLLPYYNRPELRYALESFKKYYWHRTDFEIIIIEDTKTFNDPQQHQQLCDIINAYNKELFCKLQLIVDQVVSYNSASKYNAGYAVSKGDILLLSNPETVHLGDLLTFLDKQDFKNDYYVFDCMAVDLALNTNGEIDYKFKQWYEHATIQRNYHFCSAISKYNYYNMGGFNEILNNGIAYEDDFFIAKIKQKGYNIHNVSHLQVAHIEHPRDYGLDSNKKQALVNINKKLWEQAASTNNF